MAVYGTGTLHCWPETLDQVSKCLTDKRKIDRTKFMDDSAYRLAGFHILCLLLINLVGAHTHTHTELCKNTYIPYYMCAAHTYKNTYVSTHKNKTYTDLNYLYLSVQVKFFAIQFEAKTVEFLYQVILKLNATKS